MRYFICPYKHVKIQRIQLWPILANKCWTLHILWCKSTSNYFDTLLLTLFRFPKWICIFLIYWYHDICTMKEALNEKIFKYMYMRFDEMRWNKKHFLHFMLNIDSFFNLWSWVTFRCRSLSLVFMCNIYFYFFFSF